jgi:hypothetical protein
LLKESGNPGSFTQAASEIRQLNGQLAEIKAQLARINAALARPPQTPDK